MLDKATVLSTIFTIVDDATKGSRVLKRSWTARGPAPRLSDSEVVTIALYQELIGEREKTIFSVCTKSSYVSTFQDSTSAVATIVASAISGQ